MDGKKDTLIIQISFTKNPSEKTFQIIEKAQKGKKKLGLSQILFDVKGFRYVRRSERERRKQSPCLCGFKLSGVPNVWWIFAEQVRQNDKVFATKNGNTPIFHIFSYFFPGFVSKPLLFENLLKKSERKSFSLRSLVWDDVFGFLLSSYEIWESIGFTSEKSNFFFCSFQRFRTYYT
jgi:hypothetical protein